MAIKSPTPPPSSFIM